MSYDLYSGFTFCVITSPEIIYSHFPRGREGSSLCPPRLFTTCGNCQIVCVPDKTERKRRYDLLAKGGVIVQHEDGTLEAVSNEEAETRLAAMGPERRALYVGEPKDGRLL